MTLKELAARYEHIVNLVKTPWTEIENMDRTTILSAIADSLSAVTGARFYETERGFQAELYAELRSRIAGFVLPEGTVLEQEYQKRLSSHGLTIRPDIILHEPFDPARHSGRDAGNHAVIELKLGAKREDAVQAFSSLAAMIDVLDYPTGIFINIDSERTFFDEAPDVYRARIACFAVRRLPDGKIAVVQG